MEWKYLVVLVVVAASLVQAIPRPQDDEAEEDKGGRRGGIKRTDVEEANEKSQEFFNNFQASNVPATYTTNKYLTPVLNQDNCNNSVAFASVAALETCFMRWSGKPTALSVQQLLDCGYGYKGASGCEGSPLFSYLDWVATVGKQKLTTEAAYPFAGISDKEQCPNKAVQKSGAAVKDFYVNYSGDEKMLKELVFTYYAVVTGICMPPKAWEQFQAYTGGIFKGCAESKSGTEADEEDGASENENESNDGGDETPVCQAVTVVGYGTEGGTDYWVMKNSWGASWGEKGYFRLQRNTGMCDVGKQLGLFKCVKSAKGTFAACEGEDGECDEAEEGEEAEGDEADEEEEK